MQEVQALAFRLALPKGVPRDDRVGESELIHFFESRFLDESQVIHSGDIRICMGIWVGCYRFWG